MTPSEIQSRIQQCLTRAVRIHCDQARPQVERDLVRAYLYTLCRQRARFLSAALGYLRSHELDLPQTGGLSLPELIVHPPARWEFQYVDVFGTVGDAFCCAARYRTCAQFLAVHPVAPADPLFCPEEPSRIPMRHKLTSPWFQAYRRRGQLKHELGTRHRSLVGYARSMTKREFLEQFEAKPGAVIPMVDRKGRAYTLSKRVSDVSRHALVERTGYTPEEFWREVRKPNTVAPHKPQLQLL